jgi:Transglycosylase
VSSAAIASLLGAPIALVGPVVRAKVSARAASRGIAVAVGHVRPTWRGVWLLGVGVRGREDRVSGTLDAVLVPFGAGPLEIHGGRVVLRGTLEQVVESLAPEHASVDRSARRRVELDGLGVSWTELDQHGSSVAAWGIALSRQEALDRAHVDLVVAESRGGSVEARRIDLVAGVRGAGRLRSLHVATARVALNLDALGRDGSSAPVSVAAGDAHRAGVVLALSAAGAIAQEAMPEGAELSVESARMGLSFHGEHLGFGPSHASVRRSADALELELTPSERSSPGTTPLALRGRLPFGTAAPSFELEGGPVSLAAFGVRDGELGLTHTRDATLEAHLRVELENGAINGSGSGTLVSVSLRRPELGAREVRGLKLGFRATGEYAFDGSRLSLRDTELLLGEVKAAGSLDFERDEQGVRLRIAGGVPLASCDAVVSSIPSALLSDAAGIHLAGTFALDDALTYDSAHPNTLALTLHVENGCRVVDAPPELSPDRFRSVWEREVKGPDGSPMMIRSGPGTPEWVYYDDLPHTLEVAVLVCEDGGFYRHHGFDFRAMESAMKDDIRAGRFVRGASTISMQLAKNLYLGKEKTLSRKIEEALLTMLLEAKLSKRELMELYLNVVELGPGIYGAEEAAKYYFDEDAKDLSLGQALYLASILPDPTRQHFAPDGRLMPHWAEYIKKLMRIARGVDRITDAELDLGLAEELAFRKGNGESGLRDPDATEPASITHQRNAPFDTDENGEAWDHQ